MVRKILSYPDPELKKISLAVEQIDDEVRQLAKDMAETMYAAPGVGLAAPQIGVLQRIVAIDTSAKDEPADLIVAINPEIIYAEGECCEEEGCLSVPEYYADVKRHTKVIIKGLSIDGEEQQWEAEGLLAVAFQHEIDHLDGILFVDHISPLKRGIFRRKYKKIMMDKGSQE
ncbi:MAG: peptide deformylase [Desulfuromonadales bacterium]|nr:peptide deformylase [Desulfuromonadales bacterium]